MTSIDTGVSLVIEESAWANDLLQSAYTNMESLANAMDELKSELKKIAIEAAYPVGSIMIRHDNINPITISGLENTKWERIGNGKYVKIAPGETSLPSEGGDKTDLASTGITITNTSAHTHVIKENDAIVHEFEDHHHSVGVPTIDGTSVAGTATVMVSEISATVGGTITGDIEGKISSMRVDGTASNVTLSTDISVASTNPVNIKNTTELVAEFTGTSGEDESTVSGTVTIPIDALDSTILVGEITGTATIGTIVNDLTLTGTTDVPATDNFKGTLSGAIVSSDGLTVTAPSTEIEVDVSGIVSDLVKSISSGGTTVVLKNEESKATKHIHTHIIEASGEHTHVITDAGHQHELPEYIYIVMWKRIATS